MNSNCWARSLTASRSRSVVVRRWLFSWHSSFKFGKLPIVIWRIRLEFASKCLFTSSSRFFLYNRLALSNHTNGGFVSLLFPMMEWQREKNGKPFVEFTRNDCVSPVFFCCQPFCEYKLMFMFPVCCRMLSDSSVRLLANARALAYACTIWPNEYLNRFETCNELCTTFTRLSSFGRMWYGWHHQNSYNLFFHGETGETRNKKPRNKCSTKYFRIWASVRLVG